MNLSTLELTRMRDEADAYMPDTCTLQAVTRTADSMGGWSESWGETYADISCRLSALTVTRPEGEIAQGNQLTSPTAWVLTVGYSQEVDVSWRVLHGSEYYEITQLEDTHSNRTAKRLYLRRED